MTTVYDPPLWIQIIAIAWLPVLFLFVMAIGARLHYRDKYRVYKYWHDREKQEYVRYCSWCGQETTEPRGTGRCARCMRV